MKNADKILFAIFFSFSLQINHPILLVGDTGTAKTATMLNYLKNLNPDSYVSCSLFFYMYFVYVFVYAYKVGPQLTWYQNIISMNFMRYLRFFKNNQNRPLNETLEMPLILV